MSEWLADARHTEPPADHYYASAVWLLGRHHKLASLAERAGVVSDDSDGLWLDLDELAEALARLDAHRAAWAEYEKRTWQPTEDAAYAAWEARGPQQTNERARAIGVMSRTEVSRLRLLAFFATERVQLRVSDLAGFDSEGERLLLDWSRAVLAAQGIRPRNP